MPVERLERTRASLPEGYQFGDAHVCEHRRIVVGEDAGPYCASCKKRIGWNVIDGEHDDIQGVPV